MITDPAAVKFSNEHVRRSADQMARFYYLAKQTADMWDASNFSQTFPNDTTQVNDGSVSDGRQIITGAHVNEIVFLATQLVASFEANDNAVLNTVLQVAVNPN